MIELALALAALAALVAAGGASKKSPAPSAPPPPTIVPPGSRAACVLRVADAAIAVVQTELATSGIDPGVVEFRPASDPAYQPTVDCMQAAARARLPLASCRTALALAIGAQLAAGRLDLVLAAMRRVGVDEATLSCLHGSGGGS